MGTSAVEPGGAAVPVEEVDVDVVVGLTGGSAIAASSNAAAARVASVRASFPFPAMAVDGIKRLRAKGGDGKRQRDRIESKGLRRRSVATGAPLPR